MIEQMFTVASFNIRGGMLTPKIVGDMEELLSKNEVDIAGLQEVDHLSFRSGWRDFLRIFRKDEYKYSSFFPAKSLVMRNTYGNACLSKFKLIESKGFQLPYPFKRGRLSVERRVITRDLIMLNGILIAFYNTHLCFKDLCKDGVLVRRLQIEYIVDMLGKDTTAYKVLVGDFNVSSYEEFSIFNENGYSVVNDKDNSYLTFNGDIKFRGKKEFRGIDNIVYTKNLMLLEDYMVETKLSDHNPLIARFRLIN